MFEGQPKGLFALALANTGERFGYYTMLAVFALFLRANYGLSPAMAGTIYSAFLMFVYFFPLIGGMMADKFGFGKMVTTGIIIMFAGYLLLSVPLGGDSVALVVMLAALLLIGLVLDSSRVTCRSWWVTCIMILSIRTNATQVSPSFIWLSTLVPCLLRQQLLRLRSMPSRRLAIQVMTPTISHLQ